MARLGFAIFDIFDIRADERRLLASAASCMFAGGAAVAVVTSASDALFLLRVGVAQLGTMLALSSALLIVVLGYVGALADRGGGAGRGRLLVGLCVLAAVLLLGLTGLVSLVPRLAAAALLVVTKQLAASVDLAFWVLCASRLDARQNRRLVPLFVAVQGLGAVAGSFAVGPLATALGSPGALACGASVFFLAALAALRFARAEGARSLAPATRERTQAHHDTSLRALLQKSPLATQLAWLVGVAGVFAPIVFFLFGRAASASFASEADLTAFLGQYRGMVQIVALAFQLAIAPRILSRAGVATSLLLAPLGAALAALSLGVSMSLPVMVLAQAATRVLDTAVQTPAEKLTQNLLSRHIRGRVAGFIDGVAKRAGAIVGGLLASALVVWPHALVMATLAAALAWLALAWRLRARFADMAVAELTLPERPEHHDLPEMATLADERMIDRLRAELQGEHQELAIELMSQLGERGRVDIVAELAGALARAAHRQALLEALCKHLEHCALGERSARHDWPLVVSELRAIMLDQTRSEREAILCVRALGLAMSRAASFSGHAQPRRPEELHGLHDLHDLEELARSTPDPALSLAARIAVARMTGQDLDELLDEGLELPGLVPQGQESGLVQPAEVALDELRIEVLCAASRPDMDVELVLPRTFALLRAVRRRARVAPDACCARAGLALDAVALRCAGQAHAEVVLLGSELRALALTWTETFAPPVLRAAGVSLIARAPHAQDAPRLAAALGDPDAHVRRAAMHGLRRLGPAGLDALLGASRYGRRAARSAALVLIDELRVSSEVLDRAIQDDLERMDRTVIHLAALDGLGSELVARRLCERMDELAHTLLLMLQARLTERAIEIIGRQYLRSRMPTPMELGTGSEHVARRLAQRARAVEALDTVLPRPLAGRVTGVLEDGPIELRSARAAERLGRPGEPGPQRDLLDRERDLLDRERDLPGYEDAVRAELGGTDALARALVLHALDRSGRAAHRDVIFAAAQEAARAADPMDMLRRITDTRAQRAHAADQEDDMPRSVETLMTLSKIPLFAELTTRQLGELGEVVRWHALAAGEVIVREGEPGDAMYVVASGRVRVEVTAPPDAGESEIRCVGELGPGEPFGEMALFDDAPRSATVIAQEKSRIGRIARADFEALVDDMPAIALAICRVLSRRVREQNRE